MLQRVRPGGRTARRRSARAGLAGSLAAVIPLPCRSRRSCSCSPCSRNCSLSAARNAARASGLSAAAAAPAALVVTSAVPAALVVASAVPAALVVASAVPAALAGSAGLASSAVVGLVGRLGRRQRGPQREDVARRVAVRAERVDDHRSELESELRAQLVLQRQRLGDRDLLGAGDGEHAGGSRVAQRLGDDPRMARVGPTRATPANVAGARSSPSPWPVAGASTITRS